MLIGIHLNHPVNEHPKRITNFVSATHQSSTNCNIVFNNDHLTNNPQLHQLNEQQAMMQHNIEDNNDSTLVNNLFTSSTYSGTSANNNEFSIKEGKNIDGVQTFEYQPYPASMQLDSSLSYNNNNNNNRHNYDARNYNSITYNNETMNSSQQQSNCLVRSNSKPTTLSTGGYNSQVTNGYYSTCNTQFSSSYNMIQQQQQQQHQEQFNNNYNQPPPAFNSTNNNHFTNACNEYFETGKQPTISYYDQQTFDINSSHHNNNHLTQHQEINKQEQFFKLNCEDHDSNNITTVQFNNNLN